MFQFMFLCYFFIYFNSYAIRCNFFIELKIYEVHFSHQTHFQDFIYLFLLFKYLMFNSLIFSYFVSFSLFINLILPIN